MKKWICTILAVSNIFALASCGKGNDADHQAMIFAMPPKSGMTLYTEMELDVLDNVKETDVVWSTSDSSIFSVSNGVIFAKSEGTAIIFADYNGMQQSFELTVSNTSQKPFIDETEISLVLGSEFIFSPYLYVNNVAQDDVEYLVVSQDNSIVSVAENNVLQANALGTTTLSVSATWKGIENIVTTAIPCTVNANEGIIPQKKNLVLYNLNKSFRGQTFSNEEILEADVFSQGEIVENAVIEWQSQNAEIAVVENGHVKACNVGTTTLKGTYTKENGDTIETFVDVAVQYACLDLNDDVLIGLNEMNNVVDGALYFGETYHASKMVLDKSGSEYALTDNMIAGKSFAGIAAGEYACRIYCAEEEIYCLATLVLADRVIYNAEDFFNAAQYLDAYIAVANDIDEIGERTVNITVATSSSNPQIAKGGNFTGTFNGMGHTLSDFIINTSNGGIFSGADGGATFKNFALKNVSFAKSGQFSGPLFYRLAGTCFIENVYIHVSDFGESVGSGGVLAFLYMGGLNIKNCIFVVDGITPDSRNGAIAGRSFRGVFSMKNTYIISSGNLCSTFMNAYNTTYDAVNSYSGFCYSSEEAFMSVRENGVFNFSGFNKYWNLNKDIPEID